MTLRLLTLVFLVFTLACAREQDDEWIDPYHMTLYDSTSKTMRRVPEESEKKGGTGDTAIKDLEIETSNCDNKLAILQREIEDIKHKASIVKGQLDLILVPNSKLDQLLKSIHQLRMPHKDDFCHVPGLDTYLEAARRYISVGLLSVETHLKDLSGIMSQPYVSTCLVGLITLLCLYVGIAVKWQQAQPGHRDGHGDNEAIDLQNDDGQQENQEGDGCNLEPEGHGQNPLPLTEDLAPNRQMRGILQKHRHRCLMPPKTNAAMRTTRSQRRP